MLMNLVRFSPVLWHDGWAWLLLSLIHMKCLDSILRVRIHGHNAICLLEGSAIVFNKERGLKFRVMRHLRSISCFTLFGDGIQEEELSFGCCVLESPNVDLRFAGDSL